MLDLSDLTLAARRSRTNVDLSNCCHASVGRNKSCQSGSSVTCPRRSAASRKNRFGIRRAFSPVAPSREVLRSMYGKDNRLLYSARFQSGCRQTNAASSWSSQWRYENPHDVARGNFMAKTYRAGRRRSEINYPAASLMPWRDRKRNSADIFYPKSEETLSGNDKGLYGWEAMHQL